MRTELIKFIDTLLGRLAARCITSPPTNLQSAPRHILLIRPGGIGDAVLLALPISCIKKLSPDSHITILAERRNSGAFLLIPQVDKVLKYDSPGDFIEALTTKFDLVIDTEQSHYLSAIVARLVRAPVKIGFDTNERWRMFTHPIPYAQDDYESDSFIHLLAPLFSIADEIEIEATFLSVPEESSEKAVNILASLINEPFVAIFPGASIKERRWEVGRFRCLSELLLSFGIKVVVVGGKDDVKFGEAICAGELGLNLAGLTTLAETAAVIRRSVLLLSGDSGILHIAVGLGVPTVSLFGPGRECKWAPRGDRHIVINKGLPCSPCTIFGRTPPCPINSKCMSDITVDEVFNAVTVMLTSIGAMPSHDLPPGN